MPRPKGEKKSLSGCKLSNMLFFSNKLSDMSKNEAKGFELPKNCANVARGSPWNWYVKLFVVGPPEPPDPREEEEEEEAKNR